LRYLLDTHVWLWFVSTPERIRADLLEELKEGATRLSLSAASAWEIAIKWSIKRLPLPEPPTTYVPTRMRRSRVDGLPIQPAHALQVSSLPWHHRDPFDRLLIAQAQVEAMAIVTADPQFEAYDVEVLKAA